MIRMALLYGFNLVCLRFGNKVMPDGGCIFEDRPYDLNRSVVTVFGERRHAIGLVVLESIIAALTWKAGCLLCVCQVRLESKYSPV